MHRVFLVLSGGLLLAACSSMNLDALKPEPITDAVQFESEPPGADVALSIGQNCKTPCSLKVPTNAPFTATFTLAGYQPDTEQVDLVAQGDGTNKLTPNPVMAELTAAPAPKKPAAKKKPVAKRKPAPPKPVQSSAAPPPPASTQPAQQANSPWPATPPKQQ